MNKKIITAFYLILNIFFSIVIVLLNKWLYVHTGFPNITLSMIHFVITSIGLTICEKFDVFCIKDIAIKEMFLIAMTFCGFVVLTNLSLAHNTVGTYQVAKMLTTPCVIIMQIIFYNKKFSILVKLTLIPIILGVVINFCYDIQFNIIGTIYATMGVFVTSLYQVVMVILSSIIAFFVNLTSYWIIGKTSPLTYNMVGHSKFCLLLLGGSLIFHETLAINQVIGITLTLVGIILYAHVKLKDIQVVVPDCVDKERKPLYKI
ncbi:solute carrier family 35 member E3 isoform X2 [Bombus terrestris]|uniref:Solute carrier family 35 member E3 isoform X2 n=1 Tax=Bombus terrestris TaxID=30195 RepID=A0A9B2MR47_BOMTE|nr:solute carrier family 35 member E3 isoform X2 [Bombus terrestris]